MDKCRYGHIVKSAHDQEKSAAQFQSNEPSATAKAKQRAAILAALQAGPLSSLEGRERLGVLSPAARVMELRRAGHHILTVRGTRLDDQGRSHRCGIYVLATVEVNHAQ